MTPEQKDELKLLNKRADDLLRRVQSHFDAYGLAVPMESDLLEVVILLAEANALNGVDPQHVILKEALAFSERRQARWATHSPSSK